MDEKRLERIESKVDELIVISTQNSVVLIEHARRSDALEKSNLLLEAAIKPLSTHVAVVGAIAKIVGFLGVSVGLVTTVLEVWARFRR